IVLTVNPDCSGSDWDLIVEKTEDVDLSAVESPCELKQPEPSPFSSKRTMYETEEVSGHNAADPFQLATTTRGQGGGFPSP
ncbi:hypothetical protein chiPu_0029321, partial [Chiloscyllium punctatum]|nr:hypothetical protein [Chiloscyllium punctatum]